jgi:UDP-glucose 4-epimerase
VIELVEIVRETAHEEHGTDADGELVENPRGAETTVEEFGVDISETGRRIGWSPTQTYRLGWGTNLRCRPPY